ncbi:hypothetical protein [Aurantimonas sp. VKM B-3413]|uniref:hypothetical protein n=1 Tax=Aurantimonas sp. VKM B-3413 TaxID=2779401 RepID=UPI00351D83AF
MKSHLIAAVAAAVIASAVALPATAAEDHVPAVTEFVSGNLKAALQDPVVVAAIKAQNEKTSGLSQAEIDSLDKEWRAEIGSGGGKLVDEKLNSDLSAYLKKVKADQQGAITELFVMDAKGLNVGQSDPTSDYWQGDEAKWQKSFGAGPDAVFVDEVEQDESTQELQSQASFTINDPETGKPIGAVTAGVNLEALGL